MNTTELVLLISGISLITTIALVVVIIRMIGGKRKTMNQRKLILSTGIPATALIQSIEQTNSTMGDQPGVIMEISFTKQDGEQATAVIHTFIPMLMIPNFQKGSTIPIKYLEGNPVLAEAVDAYIP